MNDAEQTILFDQADIEQNKVMAILAYILFFIPMIAAPKSRFAMFHANQGLLLLLLAIANMIVGLIPIVGWIVNIFLGIAIFVLWIIGIINAASGRAKDLPVIGQYRILNFNV